jgi:LysM repeat protein
MKPNLANLLMVLCLSPLAFALSEPQQTEQAPTQVFAIHKVLPGDCFDKIARANGCSIADLAAINGLQTDAILQVGQELKLPAPPTANKAENITPSSLESSATNAAEPPSHTIKAGDNFSKIAKLYGVSVDSLIAANPAVKPTAMRLGQKILLPESEKTAEQNTTEETKEQATSSEAKDVSATSTETQDENLTNPETNDGNATSPETQDANPTSPEVIDGDQQNPPPTAPEATEENVNDVIDGNTTRIERSARTIATDREMTYGELAAQYGTETDRLNSLNGLDLQPSTIVVKGADLLVPVGISY